LVSLVGVVSGGEPPCPLQAAHNPTHAAIAATE
jgi:hypothetical protein